MSDGTAKAMLDAIRATGFNRPNRLAGWIGGSVVSTIVGTALLKALVHAFHHTPTWVLVVLVLAVALTVWGVVMVKAERKLAPAHVAPDLVLDTMDHKRVGDEMLAEGSLTEATAQQWTNSVLGFLRGRYTAAAVKRFLGAGSGTAKDRMAGRLAVLGELITQSERGQELTPEQRLAHDLRFHRRQGQAMLARAEFAKQGHLMFGGADQLPAEIDQWVQQGHDRLRQRPELAQRFLDASPGFLSNVLWTQLAEAPDIMKAHLAVLDEIIGDLAGSGSRSRAVG